MIFLIFFSQELFKEIKEHLILVVITIKTAILINIPLCIFITRYIKLVNSIFCS